MLWICGPPAPLSLLRRNVAIDLNFRLFPDALMFLLVLLVLAAGFRGKFRRSSKRRV
jgi:hypothetical protein